MQLASTTAASSDFALTTPAVPSPDPVVKAGVKPYSVSPSLDEVSNIKAFTKMMSLSDDQKALLSKNLFAVAPTDDEQMFHIYEQNDYSNIPSFVSTDMVLQLYHVFYDSTLRHVEEEKLLPQLRTLTTGMYAQSLKTYTAATDPAVKEAAKRNLTYFAVASAQLGLSPQIPAEISKDLATETQMISNHEGRLPSAIFPYEIDYSQFVPRGHYTRSEDLKRFFRTMMWYGLVPFAMPVSGNSSDDVSRVAIQSLLMANDIVQAKLTKPWVAIYEPTSFYVGTADDLTAADILAAGKPIYGENPAPDTFSYKAKLAQFVDAISKAQKPQIATMLKGVPGGLQFRFMGQRFIPDSAAMQQLGNDGSVPTGMDVAAVFGNKRARALLQLSQSNGALSSGHLAMIDQLAAGVAATPATTWGSNLYWGWLYCLQPLNTPAPDTYPSFMHSEAWQDRSLNSTLASWAELRHDTILYAKQSAAECGGEEGPPPPKVKGYVEPNVAFYSRLAWLLDKTNQGLKSRGLLDDTLTSSFEGFGDLLHKLGEISTKELTGVKLSGEEYDTIRYIGGTIENLTLSTTAPGSNSWDLVDPADRNMALIADVHTRYPDAEEVGVGPANEILVIVPIEGKLVLTRGATLSYYEFMQPVNDRLTDERWQAMLKAGTAPPVPSWTRSFRVPKPAGAIKPQTLAKYDGGGC